MDIFDRLGQQIAHQWQAKNFDEKLFPCIALNAIEELRPQDHFSGAELVREFMLAHPSQVQTNGTFGQPPIVVYRGTGFRIEVLFWLEATTSIHQHSFSGAFQVLAGSSVHSRYQFHRAGRISSRLLHGDVYFEGSEYLTKGNAHAILAGGDFIHALFHLESPSISLVVRTDTELDCQPQYSYLAPFFAYDPASNDLVKERRAQTMLMLAQTDQALLRDIMEVFVQREEFGAVFHALSTLATVTGSGATLMDPSAVEHLAFVAQKRHGALAEMLGATLDALMRNSVIIHQRAHCRDPDLRYFLALLLNVPDKRSILELMKRRIDGPPKESVKALVRKLGRLDANGTLGFLGISIEVDPAEPASEAAARALFSWLVEALMSDVSNEEAIRTVGANVPGGLPPQDIETLKSLCSALRGPRSAFTALFR